ncbi:MAG TPA: sensor domain-containing diguanylate cyclase [Frateuria sp.]|uniref:sensor domain-containing diguanylate cyclase n=1 Tax=Frateuria sp. TaxID=2211372 RepID=UPI002D80461F|nr:sensor domain-containing diguanylate cyclase [Frateuria sp.]HET6806397.1 sensor domain-containing diguanylate cyclase [Frateuria sp.]
MSSPRQTTSPPPLPAFGGFREAAQACLGMLRERTGVGAWYFTRVDGGDWLVLAASDACYGVRNGDALRWADSICSRMVHGGPCVVPDVGAHAPYADAPIAQRGIGAYLGVPAQLDHGAVGTLCGIDPRPVPVDVERWLPVVKLCAQMLATLWCHDVDLKETRRRAERAELEAMTDQMTGIFNRRGWRELLALEEQRCRDEHTTAGVVVVDLDHLKQTNDSQGHAAGDELIRRAATEIRRAVRAVDVVARLGGDEFVVLVLDVGPIELARQAARIEQALRSAGVAATLGYSWRGPDRDLGEAYREADLLMLDAKRGRYRDAS